MPSPFQATNPWYNRAGAFSGTGLNGLTIGTFAWPTASKAIAVPVVFPFGGTLTAISVRGNGGSANYDIGLYLSTFAKYQTKGVTAHADAEETLTFTTPLSIAAGSIYYAAYVLSATAGFVIGQVPGAAAAERAGVVEQTASGTLPSTFTPAIASSTLIPLFKFTFSGLPT